MERIRNIRKKKLSRRDFLGLAAATAAGAVVTACAPEVVKEVVEVTREVEVEVAGETVVETVVEQVEVTKIVEVAVEEPVTLNFLNRGGEYIAGVMDTQMKLYQETHPDISFEINQVVGANHQDLLLMMIAAGTGPDCWFDANRTTGMLTKKGVTVNLEPFLDADPNFDEDDYIDNCWIAQTYDNARWGLPWDSGAMLIAFDLDRFDEAGIDYPDPQKWMTWDEIVELAKQLTLDMDGNTPNDAGFDPARIAQYGFIPDKSHGMFTYVWSNDADIIEADESVPIDTPEFIETVDWLADLGLKHFVSPSPAYEQATTMDMRSHNVAMQHIGVWVLGRYNAAEVNWGTMQVPYNTVKASYGHYSPLCVYSGSDHQQEAYDFIFFATCSYEGEKIVVDLGMQQPIRKDLREQFLNNPEPPAPEYRQVFYDAFEGESFRWPGDKIGSYFGGWRQPWIEMWAPYLDSVWAGTTKWEDVATELREKTEHLLETGEVT